jgi:YHS domain-containing protein
MRYLSSHLSFVEHPLAHWLALVFAALLGASLLAGSPARAEPQATATATATPPPLQHLLVDPESGLALFGHDPVAYHAGNHAVPGLARHEMAWRGHIWRFESEANRQLFAEAPEAYVPQFLGYDPLAVALGLPAPGDPAVFAVLEGRLLFFRSEERRSRFLAEPGLLATAMAAWPRVERLIGH